jgi:hypothetical protein
MSWHNPLRALPLIPQPPASLTSGLSSALTDPELFHESLLEVYNVLDNFGKRDKSNNKAASILGAFLERLPKDGKLTLITEIQSFSQDEQKLRDLAQHLVDAILKPCRLSRPYSPLNARYANSLWLYIVKLAGGNSPTPVVTPSPAEEADEIEEAMQHIESSTRQGQGALKKNCLKRDGFKCIYSGAYDWPSVKGSLVNAPKGHPVTPTECAHIIPFALGKFDDSKAVETRNKATIWSAIYRYFPALEGKINAENINQSANAIALNPATHKAFGDYNLTFWPQSQVSLYSFISFFFFMLSKVLIKLLTFIWCIGRLV